MDGTLEKLFEAYAYERIQSIVVNARTDDHYKPLWEDLKHKSKAHQEMITKCCEEYRQVSQDYLNAIHACQDYENAAIYLNGFRDCIQLMKKIGII